tara:strand:- start:5981 stop:6940 length:960 start_codon:yes stop_codon:yes gene_type:complete
MNPKLISLSILSIALFAGGIFYTFASPIQNMENYILSLALFLTSIIISQLIPDNYYLQQGLKTISLIGIFFLSRHYSIKNENNNGSFNLTVYDILKIYAIIESIIAIIWLNKGIGDSIIPALFTLIRTFFILASFFYLLYEHVNFGDKLINSLYFINIAIILVTIAVVKVFETNIFISLMVGSTLFILGIIYFTFQITNTSLCEDFKELDTSPMSGADNKIMNHLVLPLMLLTIILYESQWYTNKGGLKNLYDIKLLFTTIIYIIIMLGILFLNIYLGIINDGVTFEEYMKDGVKNPYNFIIILCILFPIFSNFVSNNS